MYTESPKALVVLVHYKAPAGVLALLDSLQEVKRRSEVAVTIVDSCSGEEYLSTIHGRLAELQNVELLESTTNRGYFGAAKFALDHYLGQGHGLPDWVIVCNHDIVIEDERFFEKLFACDPAKVGVLAPRIVIPSQALEQNPFMKKRPGWWRRFTMRLYGFAYPLGVTWDWLSRQKKALRSRMPSGMSRPERNGGRQSIYAAHGAFMIFSRRFFEAGGKLDDQLFLFGEEIVVAETCRALDLPVIYEPSLSVLHNEHQSVGHGMSRQMYGYHRASVQHVLSKYFR
jgi:GT2 family glycosyltransferase